MRMTPLMWISCGLISLTISVMLAGDWLVELAPNHDRQLLEYRRDLAESLAVQYSALTERKQVEVVKISMEAMAKRNPDILFLSLTQTNGTVIAQVGDHTQGFVQPYGMESTLDFLQVPIYSRDQQWGTLQVAFLQANVSVYQRFLTDPWVRFLGFVSVVGLAGYFFFLKRALHQLDLSGVIPTRVKTALDGLTQGIVIINMQDVIVLANDAFCQAVGKSLTSLVGSELSSLSWKSDESSAMVSVHPWTEAILEKQSQAEQPLLLDLPESEPRKFIVNTVPIIDDGSIMKGALVSFHDVTEFGHVNSSLREASGELESSHFKIQEKDQELETMYIRLQAEMTERKKAQAEVEKLHQQLRQVLRNAGIENVA